MTTYYVSPLGSDSQPGTAIDQPLATLQYAHDLAQPGDTIYLRGGTYHLSSGIHLTNSGTDGNLITIANYPGEHPVLDGSSLPGDYYGRSGAGGWILDLASASWNHISGIEIANGAMGGVVLRGASHDNILERLDVHGSGHKSLWEGKGISVLDSSARNLLLNNDSHDNHDIDKNDADGFHLGGTGSGNVLEGNRAWGNSDDGYDFFNVQAGTVSGSVLVKNNWAFHNGYDLQGNEVGDGNGFKLGGAREGSGASSGGHVLVNNVAWGNRAVGFDQNDADLPLTLDNNTSYNNGNYGFAFWSGEHKLVNNLSFGGERVETHGTSTNNSWDLALDVDAADFASLDDAAAAGPRQEDGSLPTVDFLALSSESSLIDAGVNVSRPFSGEAPDIGAFEFVPANQPEEPSTLAVAPSENSLPPAGDAFTDTAGVSVIGGRSSDKLEGTEASDTLDGANGADDLRGWGGEDVLIGGRGRDILRGGAGDDSIYGGGGSDALIGGEGSDELRGGAGPDVFVFENVADSTSAARDIVYDFSLKWDRIDLRSIDADTDRPLDQAFVFIGDAPFSGRHGELSFADGILSGDVDGDGTADFQLELPGASSLIADVFYL